MSEENTNETTDEPEPEPEPTKSELHERVEQLESTVAKMMPSRRDALRMGAAGLAGAAGLSATTQPAEASTGSAGQIGDVNNRPDVFADTVDTNNLTGVSTGADRQGCRMFLSSDQSISQGNFEKIQFDSAVYDSDNNFDTSTHNWTCPADGLYAVNLQVRFTGGGNSDKRRTFIGTETDPEPTNEGALKEETNAAQFATQALFTMNKYSSGDKIAAYARNKDTNDTLNSGAQSSNSFLEVAFLGGL